MREHQDGSVTRKVGFTVTTHSTIEPFALIYVPSTGAFAVIADAPEDRIADVDAMAALHAARIVRALVPYVSTNWQRVRYSPTELRSPAASPNTPCPSDSSEDPRTGDAAAYGAGYLARARRAQAEARRRGLCHPEVTK